MQDKQNSESVDTDPKETCWRHEAFLALLESQGMARVSFMLDQLVCLVDLAPVFPDLSYSQRNAASVTVERRAWAA